MAKAPRLGNLHRFFPKWWHHVEPDAVSMENFRPRPGTAPDQQEQSRFEKLADIALNQQSCDKADKRAA